MADEDRTPESPGPDETSPLPADRRDDTAPLPDGEHEGTGAPDETEVGPPPEADGPPAAWSGRAAVRSPSGGAPADEDWTEEPTGRWWLPVVIALLALAILAALAVGVWLITEAVRDAPAVDNSPSPSATVPTSAPTSGSPSPRQPPEPEPTTSSPEPAPTATAPPTPTATPSPPAPTSPNGTASPTGEAGP